MSLQGHFRNGIHGAVCIRAVLAVAALFAVLAARDVPPQFAKATRVHSTICADSHSDQRPRFDDSGSKWSAPADSLVPALPTAESAQMGPTPRLFSSLQLKGFHFNRPPPIS